MNILLTNDDGIFADGLQALYLRLIRNHSVVVAAPDRERSAIGHAISLNEPLRIKKIEQNGTFSGFAISGTPADCVKLGIFELFREKPDIVISGINPGPNLGMNLFYSGTVAAAREAAFSGIPGIAVSIGGRDSTRYADAADFIASLIGKVHKEGLPFGVFLNVNYPDCKPRDIKGVRITRQNIRMLDEYFEKRNDPRKQPYFWQGIDLQMFGETDDVDGNAFSSNYISITPLMCDMTDLNTMKTIRNQLSEDWQADRHEKN